MMVALTCQPNNIGKFVMPFKWVVAAIDFQNCVNKIVFRESWNWRIGSFFDSSAKISF